MEHAGIKHNMKTYSMLINGFLKLKDWANAFAIFEDLIRDGIKPDVVLYNNIITAFCGMGKMDRAICTVKEMQKQRHRPTTRTFMPIIHGFARKGEMRKALDVFDMMRMSGCIPTVHTYNALILGLVEKRKVGLPTFSYETFNALEILSNHSSYQISPVVVLSHKITNIFLKWWPQNLEKKYMKSATPLWDADSICTQIAVVFSNAPFGVSFFLHFIVLLLIHNFRSSSSLIGESSSSRWRRLLKYWMR